MNRLPVKIVLLLTMLAPLLTSAANLTPEQIARKGIDQVINLQMDDARNTFTRLAHRYPDYSLTPFLDATVYWAEAEAARKNRNKLVQLAIQKMEQAAKTADEALYIDPDHNGWLLTRGMSNFFAARMHADRGRTMRAYQLGRSGRDDLRALIEKDPEANDAYLVLGMYEYIAGSIPRGLRWLAVLFDLSGDIDKGVQYLERGTSKALIMAPEAARMLLVAAGLKPETTRTCAYLPLAKNARKRYPANPHYSIALQLILVNCGYPKQALLETTASEKQFLDQFPKLKNEFEAIRIYAYRDLGDIKKIESLKNKFIDDEYYWKLILAETHDVIGNRRNAVEIYDEIFWADLEGEEIETSSGPSPDWIIERASKYRKKPYQAADPDKKIDGDYLTLS